MKFWEVSIQRAQIATLDVHIGLAAKNNGAESIPLRFIQKTAVRRKRVGQLRQHGFDGRLDGECHARARLRSGAVARTSVVFFLPALTASRLFRSASIKLTTLGGASISGATTSRPSIFASMISRRPS